ncbi:tail fiber protein [Phage MedPE-SWcel-C56]|uniref:Uncharacterized protein n=1 Tax=Phage MedPE-SWcel-C56 TaxID=1871314 RepID=A0A1B1IY42_9CAUD|nr:tail fiber protein [Phage MedPE-SWcel-C56]ANS06238.1 hypothetical protein [Phage MedPE-SWcel-C56]
MGLSTITSPYTGGPQTFSVGFALGYIKRSDVRVYVEGEFDGSGDRLYRDFTWNSDDEILVTDPITEGLDVTRERTVSKTELEVDFNAPGTATRENLNTATRQSMMVMHEIHDGRLTLESGTEISLQDAIDGADAAAALAVEAAAVSDAYKSRADAIAANVLADTDVIRYITAGGHVLTFAECLAIDTSLAMTTNGGTRYWKPADSFVCPQHYADNTVPGTTDMIGALDAMSAGIAHYALNGVAYPNHTALYRGARTRAPMVISFLGERVGISRPWLLGAMDVDHDNTFDVGPGAIYGAKLANGRLVSLAGFDASPLATHDHPTEGTVTTVPGHALVVGTYELTDKKATQENVFYVDGVVVDDTFEIDCNFVSGGLYVMNTNRTQIGAAHIFNLAKGTKGIETGVSDAQPTPNHLGNFNPMSGAPFATNGSQVKNPELRIVRTAVSGRNRQGGIEFPVGETDLTMDTTAIGIYTADFHLDAPIITATTTSIEFDLFSNGQFYNAHPWSNNIIYGPNCNNMITSGGYWDYTDVSLYSFRHLFTGCSWGAGSANLRLVATTADEDADGLVLDGCRFYNSSTINYGSEASGSWVGGLARKHVISGVFSELGDLPLLQAGDTLRVGADGTVTVSNEGNPGAYLATAADGSFLIVPYDGAGTTDINNQLRFDVTHGAWRFGRSNPGSNGVGFIMRSPNGTEFKVSIDDSGALTSTQLL